LSVGNLEIALQRSLQPAACALARAAPAERHARRLSSRKAVKAATPKSRVAWMSLPDILRGRLWVAMMSMGWDKRPCDPTASVAHLPGSTAWWAQRVTWYPDGCFGPYRSAQEGYSRRELAADAAVHLTGVLMGCVGALLMLERVADPACPAAVRVALGVYASSVRHAGLEPRTSPRHACYSRVRAEPRPAAGDALLLCGVQPAGRTVARLDQSVAARRPRRHAPRPNPNPN